MASVKPRPGYGYEVRYVDPATGKRPSKTFKLKKDADAYRRKVEREIEDGTHTIDADAATVSEVCGEYMKDADHRAARGEIGALRVVRVEQMVRCHIIPSLGSVRFRDITCEQIDRFYREMTTTGGLHPFTARQTIGNLRTIERFAIRRNYLKTAPVAAALSGLRPVSPTKIRTFEPEQVAALLRLSGVRHFHQRHRSVALLACFVHIGAFCGLRAGEIRALRWSDIDFDRSEIRVFRSITDLDEMKTTKTAAGVRTVPMPTYIGEMLTAWRERYFLDSKEDVLFASVYHRPVKHREIGRAWHGLLERAGLYEKGRAFHFHALRHFAGSWWLDSGMKITDVSVQLGHANVATTMKIYTHSLTKPEERAREMGVSAARLLRLTDATVTQIAA